jgi:hypothetical protein
MAAKLSLLRVERSGNMSSNTLLSNTLGFFHSLLKQPTSISELEKTFPVSIDRELEPLFKQDPQLISAVQKSIEIAHRHFDREQLCVEMIRDPESSELDRLSVIVKTSLDTVTAFEKISSVNAESLKDYTLRNILIHVEFQ